MTAEPPYVQYLNNALRIEPFLNVAEDVFKEEISSESDLTDDETIIKGENRDTQRKRKKNGYLNYHSFFSASDWEEEKRKFFNLETINGERGWLKEILLSDSSEDSGDDESLSEGEVKDLLQWHIRQKKIHRSFARNPSKYQDDFQFFGSSFVLERDRYHDFQRRHRKEKKVWKKKSSGLHQRKKRGTDIDERRKRILEEKLEKKRLQRQREADNKRKKLWILIARKEIPKAWRQRNNARSNQLQTLKKVSHHCSKEIRKEAVRSQKITKEMAPRARRLVREVLLYWKKFDKVEKEHRKKAEKEALEQRRLDEEMREMRRQQRKLNFLITQTELYAHFMSRKMKGPGKDNTHDDILKKLDEPSLRNTHMNVKGGVLVDVESQDDYDADAMKAQALLNAQNAVMMQKQKTRAFDDSIGTGAKLTQESFDQDFSLANPKLFMKTEKGQPAIFSGKLKTYQLKGMNWLADLYEQGINGILADEMGLGKTVQSIAFLAYLAEFHDIWGPFLVVAPASTLHNWQQEASRFVPDFKVLPYWGNPSDRKSLRKFWNQRQNIVNTKESAPFHVLITSYQLVVQDVRYFQRIKWQYLVLDEAQAIKSSASVRWKILLGFNCRNRLLLTGTPIQNSMAELWALLHFIMPTLFDSHEEFNEWFSKDIEGHAENKTNLDQNQLSRLHMILKPFMLRRVKKDVENELSDKIEIKLVCHLSSRQRFLYQAIKNKISIEDLVASSSSSSSATLKSTSTLMNLVMQFRKVCNHPEIFERRDVKSPLFLKLDPLPLPKLIYKRGLLKSCEHSRFKLLYDDISIWRKDLIMDGLRDVKEYSAFSFSKFINMSPSECHRIFADEPFRLLRLSDDMNDGRLALHFGDSRKDTRTKRKLLGLRDFILWPWLRLSLSAREKSPLLQDMVFVSCSQSVYALLDHRIYHRRDVSSASSFFSVRTDESEDHRTLRAVPTAYPRFLDTSVEKVTSPPQLFYASDRDAAYKAFDFIHGDIQQRHAVLYGSLNPMSPQDRRKLLFPPPLRGLEAARPDCGWSHMQMPDRNALITDSGKLKVLDELLSRLKAGGHRVLIYSQMTRMIDILEEFMVYRKYKYMRLDGSSKISDRRDMVSDFQTKTDIFVFLLSTRAGGLGINLTAADTVIFYDSDWNPTVDQQAMDRAHRLGQTKQVTVYRLVTKGSIEERILQRAKEKSEIQKLVISGGHFKPDALKPKEVVSLLLDDDEMENKFKLKQAERRSEEQTKKGGRKRKRAEGETEKLPTSNHVRKRFGNLEMPDNDSSSQLPLGDASATCDSHVDSVAPHPFCDESLESTDVVSLNFNEDSNTSLGTPQSSRPPSTAPVVSEPPSPIQESAPKRGKARGRGRGRGASAFMRSGSGKVSTPKGRGGKSKGASLNVAAAAAAAAAGAAAASAAAYAAYGFSFQATANSNASHGTEQ